LGASVVELVRVRFLGTELGRLHSHSHFAPVAQFASQLVLQGWVHSYAAILAPVLLLGLRALGALTRPAGKGPIGAIRALPFAVDVRRTHRTDLGAIALGVGIPQQEAAPKLAGGTTPVQRGQLSVSQQLSPSAAGGGLYLLLPALLATEMKLSLERVFPLPQPRLPSSSPELAAYRHRHLGPLAVRHFTVFSMLEPAASAAFIPDALAVDHLARAAVDVLRSAARAVAAVELAAYAA
jgi:hypothetical protein